jgi:hypothetical protein
MKPAYSADGSTAFSGSSMMTIYVIEKYALISYLKKDSLC